jgi:quercetin dioxygenase-like cupin family protein
MRNQLGLLAVFAALALSQPTCAQDAHAFFRGDVFPPPRDTPAAWLIDLHKADELFNANITVATFLPNTRLAWHNHPGGQVLLVTDGVGYYQEKGKQKQIVRPGDVIECAPGVEHWHGGSVESGLTYVAISPVQKGATVWGQPVTDEDYRSEAVDRRTAVSFRKDGVAISARLVNADSVFPFDVVSTAFVPAKKADWRKDSGGQILVFIEGTGYYQEKEKPLQVARKGDVIKSAPGVEHWQGASSESGTGFFAITPRKP